MRTVSATRRIFPEIAPIWRRDRRSAWRASSAGSACWPWLRAMPEQDQCCLSLRAEGLRYRDIAEVLGISLGSVANSLERALSRLARADSYQR